MMTHQYANYVVQKMIEVAVERQFNVIMDVVIRNKGMLVNYTHGRHVITHVERLINARAGFPGSLPPTP
uniref:PUM-HD domain-containing protein n=1 Tax=Triticum urartu TaxID=4572 RepID=A0A8R7U6Y1_TRIUA